jgi:Prophage tail length tape measure protein
MAFRELINLIGFELDEVAMDRAEKRTKVMFENMKDFGEKWSLRVSAPIIAAATFAVNKFGEYNEELAIVRQRIEATGGTAGHTADQLDEMSNTLSEGIKASHEEVLAGEEALLRFSNVTGKTYDRATKAAIDFAAANKMDVASAAKFLGRALEGPGEGMRRLAMMGIYFTAVERKRLQAMVDSGRIAQAQAVILDRVERSTKGSAKAVADASTGFYKLKK